MHDASQVELRNFIFLRNNGYCYVASAETKRDWLIRGHVTLNKCNVSLGQQVKNCCPATMHKEQNGSETRKFKN